MRITFVISSLSAGGAEKTVRDLTRFLREDDYHITVITMDNAGSDFYTLDHAIERIELDLLRETSGPVDRILTNINRVRTLAKAIRSTKPDIVLSFMDTTNILTLIANSRSRFPIVVSERTDPRLNNLGAMWQFLRQRYYPRADAIVVLTDEVKEWAKDIAPSTIVETIPCAVNDQSAIAQVEPDIDIPHDKKLIVSVGRFRPVKGFDVLVEAFAQTKDRSSWHLIILGDGPERNRIEERIKSHQLEDHVTLPGLVRNPSSIVAKADLYVCPSRNEGFGNALLEAMALGVPVVATNTSGPRSMIKNGANGLLVEPNDPADLARGMEDLMSDVKLRDSFSQKSIEVKDRYSIERILNLWKNLIRETSSNQE